MGSTKNIYQQQVENLQADNKQTLDTLSKNFDMYRSMLDRNKVNSQAQLASATEKSRAMMDNYLKALGLYGSGAGQSEYANLGASYQNNLASINNDYQNDLMNAQMQYDKDVLAENKEFRQNMFNAQIEEQNQNDTAFTNAMNEMQDIGATAEQMREYYEENKGKISEGLQSQWEKTLNIASENNQKELNKNYSSLSKMINSLDYNEDFTLGDDSNTTKTIDEITNYYNDGMISKTQYDNIRKEMIDNIIKKKYPKSDKGVGELYELLHSDLTNGIEVKDYVINRSSANDLRIKDGDIYIVWGDGYRKWNNDKNDWDDNKYSKKYLDGEDGK